MFGTLALGSLLTGGQFWLYRRLAGPMLSYPGMARTAGFYLMAAFGFAGLWGMQPGAWSGLSDRYAASGLSDLPFVVRTGLILFTGCLLACLQFMNVMKSRALKRRLGGYGLLVDLPLTAAAFMFLQLLAPLAYELLLLSLYQVPPESWGLALPNGFSALGLLDVFRFVPEQGLAGHLRAATALWLLSGCVAVALIPVPGMRRRKAQMLALLAGLMIGALPTCLDLLAVLV
jgi:hypothetical protein